MKGVKYPSGMMRSSSRVRVGQGLGRPLLGWEGSWGGSDRGGGQSGSARVQATETQHLEQFPLVSGTDERHFSESLKSDC